MTVYKQVSTCQDFKHLSEQVGNEMEIKSQPWEGFGCQDSINVWKASRIDSQESMDVFNALIVFWFSILTSIDRQKIKTS